MASLQWSKAICWNPAAFNPSHLSHLQSKRASGVSTLQLLCDVVRHIRNIARQVAQKLHLVCLCVG
jgi:hypothetical protein